MRPHDPMTASVSRGQSGYILAAKLDGSSTRRVRTDQNAEKRGLAGAVWPDDADGLIGLHRKVDIRQHRQGAEAFGDA